METIIAFKNVEKSSTLKERAEKKAEKINKMFKEASTLNYTFSKDNLDYVVDVVLQGSGNIFKASANSSDFVLAIDEVVEKILVQLKKHKERTDR